MQQAVIMLSDQKRHHLAVSNLHKTFLCQAELDLKLHYGSANVSSNPKHMKEIFKIMCIKQTNNNKTSKTISLDGVVGFKLYIFRF